MSRLSHMLVFLGVGSTLVVGWHRYLWVRLVRDTALAGTPRAVATAAIVSLGVAMVVMLPLGRALPRAWAAPFAWVAFGWMGFAFLLFVALVGADLAKLVLGARSALAASGAVVDPERRALIARGLAGVSLAVGLVLGASGVASARGRAKIARVRVPLAKLPAALDGLTIVQISDLHVGPTVGRAMLARIVDEVNALGADLVAITGDLVDGSVAELGADVAELGRLASRHGTFFVTGNHEYYAGAAAWVDELSRLGVRVLRNEHVTLGHAGGELDLAGVDDFSARGLATGHAHDLPSAVRGRDESRVLVLLAHQPRSVFEAARLGVDLQLSGHTHGGQIFPWNWLVRLQQPFVAGLHQVGATWLYVSRGTGYWGPPMRVGSPPEITVIELTRA